MTAILHDSEFYNTTTTANRSCDQVTDLDLQHTEVVQINTSSVETDEVW